MRRAAGLTERVADAEHAEAEAIQAKDARGRERRKFKIHANLRALEYVRHSHRVSDCALLEQ